MKRWITMLAFAAAAAVIQLGASRGQGPAPRPAPVELGPGEQGAQLKQPWMDPPSKPAPPPNSYEKLWNPAAAGNPFGKVDSPLASTATKIALPPTNSTDINREFELTKDHGAWVIFLIAYSGERAPEMANKCVREMRSTYRLNAFVFNYGAEEKRKEYERVQRLKEQQKQELIKNGVQGDIMMPVRVRAVRIDEQTGVLLAGGYKSREEAQAALNTIRKLIVDKKLPEPDPRKIDMEAISDFQEEVVPTNSRTPKINQVTTKQAFVSPFVNAFAARNPCLPKDQQTPEQQKTDMEFLRKVNAGEPLSLLNCKKNFTICIKQFNTQVMVQDRPKQATGFLDTFFKKQESVDYAAKNAVHLAELMRRAGCQETYVLHAKYSSFVTVGAFDRPDDPRMVAMQSALESYFRTLSTGADVGLAQVITKLELEPRPMQIPH